MMTVFWLILAGLAAIIVDLGLVRQRRADAQAAADSGVLAALSDLSAGDATTAQLTALAYAAENGFADEDVEIRVPPTSGRRAGDNRCIEVEVSDAFKSMFAEILGVSELDASARAVGCADDAGGSVPALFAASTNCAEKNLKLSASTTTIIGAVHSNASIELSGSDNLFDGDVNWSPASYFLESGAGNWFGAAPASHSPIAWPIEFNIADFMPGGARASTAQALGQYYNAGVDDISIGWLTDNGAYDPSTHVLQPGIYYTQAKVDVSDSDITIAGGGGVTLVSSGHEVKLSGSNHDIAPYVDDLLIFADYQKQSPQSSLENCDSSAADLSGSGSAWEGIIYVPRGQVTLSGSLNTSVSGAVLAHTIELSGQDLSIDSSNLGGPTAAIAKLVE